MPSANIYTADDVLAAHYAHAIVEGAHRANETPVQHIRSLIISDNAAKDRRRFRTDWATFEHGRKILEAGYELIYTDSFPFDVLVLMSRVVHLASPHECYIALVKES